MSQVTKDQIKEWTENPVTLELKSLLLEEIKEAEEIRGTGAYHPFEPNKTQEVLAGVNGYKDALDSVAATLEGHGLWPEEDDE